MEWIILAIAVSISFLVFRFIIYAVFEAKYERTIKNLEADIDRLKNDLQWERRRNDDSRKN